MQDFKGYEEVVHRMAEARRIARDNAPRTSNDELEAGLMLAMIFAYNAWAAEQPSVQPSEPAAAQPDVGTEAVQQPEQPQEPSEPQDPEDPGPAPHRRGRR